MKHEIRQRIIDTVATEQQLTPAERETSIGFSKADDTARVFSANPTVMKCILAHDDAEIHHIEQIHSDQLSEHSRTLVVGSDIPDEFDDDKDTISVMGEIPMSSVLISTSNKKDTLSSTVSNSVTEDYDL